MFYLYISLSIILMMINISLIRRRKINTHRTMLLNMLINQSIPVLVILSVILADNTLIDIAFFYILLSFVPILGFWLYYQRTHGFKPAPLNNDLNS